MIRKFPILIIMFIIFLSTSFSNLIPNLLFKESRGLVLPSISFEQGENIPKVNILCFIGNMVIVSMGVLPIFYGLILMHNEVKLLQANHKKRKSKDALD